jgi:manganese transport protein
VILVGFVYDVARSGLEPLAIASGTAPRLDGPDSLLLAAGMLGATVMPHAIYLHSALTSRRYQRRTSEQRSALLRGQRADVIAAMTVAGVMNLLLLVIAAAALHRGRSPVDTIEGAHAAFGTELGTGAALLFALALLASGFAASSVGTLAGQVVMEGFLRRHVPLVVRRLVTLAPALVVLGVGVDPTRALIGSQVVLSFGIPFALVPLVMFTRRADLMGALVNRRLTTVAASAVAAVIIALNGVLLWQTALS